MSGINVDTPHEAYGAMSQEWSMVDALLAGTKAMREAGQTYLPKEPRESDEAYAIRLRRTVLFEGYKRSVDTLVGRPLMETISFTDDMPEDVQDWLNDVDLAGSDINTFTRDVFFAAVHYGKTHILVDYPRTGGALRLDQQRKNGVRPYWVHVTAPQLIAWRLGSDGHREVLEHIRFAREVSRRDGEWGTKTVQQVFVMDRNYDPDREEYLPGDGFVLLRIYEQNDSGQWDVVSIERLTITEIPLVTVYANRKSEMVAEPAFLGVAHLNVAHWQSSSDQRNILHVCRVPILFGRNLGSKLDSGELIEFEVGPNRLIVGEEDNSDLKFVEHTGAAIKAGADDLQNLKDEMALLAMEVMTKRGGSVTATEKAIDTAAANGALIGMVRNLQAALNGALNFMGSWVGRTDMGMVDINTDFRIATDAADLEVLWKARLNGDLSAETFWNECLRRGVLAEDFDDEQERERLEEEKEKNSLPPPPMVTPEEEDDLTAPSPSPFQQETE